MTWHCSHDYLTALVFRSSSWSRLRVAVRPVLGPMASWTLRACPLSCLGLQTRALSGLCHDGPDTHAIPDTLPLPDMERPLSMGYLVLIFLFLVHHA